MNSASSPTSKQAPLLQRQARQVSRLHRWLGTGFCLLFALWFGTGFVMMYVPFPALPDGARIAASAPVRLDAVMLPPSAAAHGFPVQRLRLVDVLGRPRYLATLDGGGMLSIAADTGGFTAPLDMAAARRVAERFAGQTAAAVEGPFDHDQWVVHQRFDAVRPFYRVELGDAAGTELYVSAPLGQVLQRTTRFERGWNWVGAVVHWIYPTFLRKSLWAWDQLVWWLALAGTVVAASGWGLGVVRMVNLRRAGRGGLSPFRGWVRWHHLIGLVGGAFALTWVFSGWLSMDHGRLFSLDQPAVARLARLRGTDMATAMTGVMPATLQALGSAREIEFAVVGGQAFIIQRNAADTPYRLTPVLAGVPRTPLAAIPDALLADAVAAAWAPARVRDIAGIAVDDEYGHMRSEPLPDSARRVRLDDAAQTWVHMDARSGQLIGQMDSSRRAYRWLYNGLHTFDFPLLNRAGPLWRVLMLAALAAGMGLSVSALVLGGRRMARASARGRRRT